MPPNGKINNDIRVLCGDKLSFVVPFHSVHSNAHIIIDCVEIFHSMRKTKKQKN